MWNNTCEWYVGCLFEKIIITISFQWIIKLTWFTFLLIIFKMYRCFRKSWSSAFIQTRYNLLSEQLPQIETSIDFFSIQYIFVNPLFYFFTFTAINPFMLHPSRLSSRIVVNFRETGSIRMPRNEHECTRFTRMMIGEEGETNERRRKKRKRGGRRKKRRLTSPRVESP